MSLLLLVGLTATGQAGQTESEWSLPANLSQSGATTEPQLVIDRNGRHHVLWQDALDGYVYVAGDGQNWSNPRVVETPFQTRRTFPDLPDTAPTPTFESLLLADHSNRIHAFWVDTVTNEDGILFHSSVPASRFAEYTAWATATEVDLGVVGQLAAVDPEGRLSVAYVRTLEDSNRPAGIYVASQPGWDETWNRPVLVYPSRYLRSASSEGANVSLSTHEPDQVMVAWSDSGREQVFVARSTNGGRTFSTPFEVDRRAATDASSNIGPSNIAIGASDSSIIATWQAAHESGTVCSQYYRVSADNGESWASSQVMETSPATCFDEAHFFTDNGDLFLMGITQDDAQQGAIGQSAYLMAWDGVRWSNGRRQDALIQFVNPETNQPVQLGCLSSAAADGQLVIVGCDRNLGADIWWTEQTFGETSTWFSQDTSWLGPDILQNTPSEINELVVISNALGTTHAFWPQDESPAIFTSHLIERGWSTPTPIIQTDVAQVDNLAAASDTSRLYLIWGDGEGIQFAQASVDAPREWSEVKSIAGPEGDPRDLALMVARNGELFVTYAMPLNEPRGVYLIRSADRGGTWSAPQQIFDGAAAGWEAVANPILAQTSDSRLHLLWEHQSLPPESASLSLAYGKSDDIGLAWSPEIPIVAGPTSWSTLETASDQTIHLLWGEDNADRNIIWHQLSRDSGDNWSDSSQISSLARDNVPVSALDPAGRPHVVGIDNDRLHSWFFNGESWEAGEPFPVGQSVDHLAATVDIIGQLVVTYVDTPPGSAQVDTNQEVLGLIRPLDLPSDTVIALSSPTPQPTRSAEPTAVPTPAPSPTPPITIPIDVNEGPPGGLLDGLVNSGGRFGQLGIAIIPAGIVVAVVVLVALRALRMSGRRN